MLPIKSLLNPEPERQFRVPPPPPFPAPSSGPLKRKMAKDAPVFLPGKIQGECRYPPCEDRTAELERIHTDFKLRPMGNIADYPRHIPYASEKKSFQQKTGRDSFHVFQYTFQIPGEDREWHVMWDYNIGIVRITHLFKCNGYAKTTPGKMLAQNNGLRDICHSITGGALAAQGYWMPFDAAKALAATFCWKIRHVLTPLFGTDFPAMCIHPEERKRHGVMVIDPEITRRATATANYYRSLEMAPSPRPAPAPVTTYHLIRDMDEAFKKDSPATLKLAPIKYPRHKYTDSIASGRDYSAEPFALSPKSQSPSAFTPINAPRNSNATPRSRVDSPKTIMREISNAMHSQSAVGGISEDSDTDSDGSSNVYSTPDCPSLDQEMDEKVIMEGPSDMDSRRSESDLTDSDEDWLMDDANDEDYPGPTVKTSFAISRKRKAISTGPDSQIKSLNRKTRSSRPRSSPHFAREVKAAEALLRLHMNELENTEVETEVDENITQLSMRPRYRDVCGEKRRASL